VISVKLAVKYLNMTATAETKRIYTVDEYLKMEARSGERYEFYNGNIIPMPGGTIPHNRICRNIIQHLGNALDLKSGFEIFGSDQKIYLPEYLFTCTPMPSWWPQPLLLRKRWPAQS